MLVEKKTIQPLSSIRDSQEKDIYDAFSSFVDKAKSDAALTQLTEFLIGGKINEAIEYINSFAVPMANTVVDAFVNSADAGFENYKLQFAAKLDPRKVGTFNTVSPAVLLTMQQIKAEFIRQFNDTQDQVLRAALTDAIQAGLGTRAMALEMRDAIGLNLDSLKSVDMYRTVLQNSSANAVDQSLRKAEKDVSSGALTASQIERMVNSYRNNFLTIRAQTIARTEAVATFSQGTDAAIRQVVDQYAVDPLDVRRTWNCMDYHSRSWHISMEGQTVGLDETFTDGYGNQLQYPGDKSAPANTRVNCQCSVTHSLED